jgi:hypothetical protein
MNLDRMCTLSGLVAGLILTACKPAATTASVTPAVVPDPVTAAKQETPSSAVNASAEALASTDPPSAEPSPSACEAAVSDTPTALFDERVLLRVPLNVELVETNATFATTFQSAGFVSACDATVHQMSVLKFANDKSELGVFVHDFINSYLVKGGFTDGSRGIDRMASETDLRTVVEYPAGNGQPAMTMYIAVTRKLDFIIVATYLATPDEFAMLEPTFQESASRIFVAPAS